MKPTPFNAETDLATTPFDQGHCELAAELKEAGLPWKPHVGCFVWDVDAHIEVSSPFPGRIYFILNLGHFLKRFETIDNIAGKLVWLPTWHQTRLLCDCYNVDRKSLKKIWQSSGHPEPGDELLAIYTLLLQALKTR